MRITNNLPALTAFTALNSTNKTLNKTIKSLSTGLRINSASDDAAGFAVSEKMRSQIGGLDMALRNSQDGTSLLQTAEGALSQTNDMLQRMRSLAIQASNDSLTSNDRQHIQLEIEQLRDEVDRIAGTTQFNKKRILDGLSGALWASSDSGVRARINGGLTYADKFGQKVSSEGNYRIEVKASPGQAQVQKSNIFNLTHVDTIHTQELVPIPEDALDGNLEFTEININNPVRPANPMSEGWNFQNGRVSIFGEGKNEGRFKIFGDVNVPTSNYVKIAPGADYSVLLSNVNINVSRSEQTSAISMDSGANIKMYIEGNNFLQSGAHAAGIGVYGDSSIAITSISGDTSYDGELTVKAGKHAAGIGGSCVAVMSGSTSGGNILIKGGTINAYGGEGSTASGGYGAGAGIGGGGDSDVKSISIIAGKINAYGGEGDIGVMRGGAGIGSGASAGSYANSSIIISGGEIYAEGYTGGAGIGGGDLTDAGSILIKEGLIGEHITARAINSPMPYPAQDIGAGHGYSGTYKEYRSNTKIYIPGVEYIQRQVKNDVIRMATLAEIPTFNNSNGISLLSQPQTLNITQGNGQSASITLYATDTMKDVAEKINHVIADTFGHAQRTDNPAKFCTLSDGTEGTSESVYGTAPIYEYDPIYDDKQNIIGYTPRKTGYSVSATMLIRSGIPGKDGELFFSGDDDLLNALGLNTIQESTESRFTASVYDAHSGAKVNTMTAEGSEFKSIIPPEIDIDIDPMTTAISSSWDENTKRFIFAHNHDYMAMLHLKDNGITFQTGANGGEDFSIQLGDMSTNALYLSRVNVATRETASRSIGILDRAISRVSSQRAKIGSYINGLEHTMTNLTTTSANLTDAESRIRDTDMAKTMMDFVRLQILNQSGTSMLSQANQIPRSVLSLLGN